MGKSQETFNKKENEKRKQKKRQDKQEKREERKNNADRNQNMEDMFAYVDEDGNLTSTPPDPSKKRSVNVDDIILGVPKQDPNTQEIFRKGIVTFYNEAKGYGFIKDLNTQESIFVHSSNLEEPIKENNKVSFEMTTTSKGPSAINVKKVK